MKWLATIIAALLAIAWLNEGVYLGSYRTPAQGSLRGQTVAHEYLVCRHFKLLEGLRETEYWPPGTDPMMLDVDGTRRYVAQLGCPKRWPWDSAHQGLETFKTE